MPRYSVTGFRGGETIQTPSGDVRLHAVDGAADLTADQLAWLKSTGLTLVKASDKVPDALQSSQPGPSSPEAATAAVTASAATTTADKT